MRKYVWFHTALNRLFIFDINRSHYAASIAEPRGWIFIGEL